MAEPRWLRIARNNLGRVTGPNNCALFVGECLELSGLPSTNSIKARSYLEYGQILSRPRVGSLVVLWRKEPSLGLGHIGFYLYHSDNQIVLLSSYKGLVSLKAFSKKQLLGYRWPNVSSCSKSDHSTVTSQQ